MMSPNTTEAPTLLNVRAAAKYLGISVPSIWRLLKDGELPRTRIGGRTLIRRDALEALVAANTEAA